MGKTVPPPPASAAGSWRIPVFLAVVILITIGLVHEQPSERGPSGKNPPA